MPYTLTFRKQIPIADRGQYINDCCIGGDVVLDRLLPALRANYGDIMSNQEDWGWFAWFDEAGIKLAVDIHTLEEGEFQIHLTSRKPRFLLSDRIEDTPELEKLRQRVVKELEAWPVEQLKAGRVDEQYM